MIAAPPKPGAVCFWTLELFGHTAQQIPAIRGSERSRTRSLPPTVASLVCASAMMVDMLKSLEQSLRRYRLVHSGERVGVAVSGGADSVALLRALAALAPELGIVPVVLHLNHQLRGKESDADQSFVAALAQQLSLEAVIGSARVSANEGLSLEAAAMEEAFEKSGP